MSAFSETSGIAETFTPSAVSKSALPDLLLAARFPCFATGKPAAAVETLLRMRQRGRRPTVDPCLESDLEAARSQPGFGAVAPCVPRESS